MKYFCNPKTSSCFIILYTSKPLNDTSTPSKLEILFLLNSGDWTSILKIPPFKLLPDENLKCSRVIDENPTQIFLTVSLKAEIVILFDVTLIWQASLDDKSRTFVILFAVANVKCKFFGTLFIEKHVKLLYIAIMSLCFRNPTHLNNNTTCFTSHKKRNIQFSPIIIPLTFREKKFH